MTRNTSFSLTADDVMRSFLGGDTVFDRLHQLRGTSGNFPPFNVREVKADSSGGATYELELAVAGYDEDEITVEEVDGRLVVRGEKKSDIEDDMFIYRGIAARDFHREWILAEHVHVISAKLKNGMLLIELEREVPEEKKPRQIQINK